VISTWSPGTRVSCRLLTLKHAIRLTLFAAVGLLNTLADFTIFFLLLSYSPLPASACNIVSYASGIALSYVINRHLTFRDRQTHRVVGPIIFLATGLVGLAINTLVVVLSLPFVGTVSAKIAATLVTFAWNYSVSNLIVFTETSRSPRS
jgi:putative flippase GtrA